MRMPFPARPMLLIGAISLLCLSGCSHWPKDSLIRGAEVVTPWGRTSAEVIATGKAATNLTEAERAEILKATPKK